MVSLQRKEGKRKTYVIIANEAEKNSSSFDHSIINKHKEPKNIFFLKWKSTKYCEVFTS